MTATAIPDPTALHPLAGHDRVVLLRPLVTDPRIEVGAYTYFDDPDGATRFEQRNVLYAYGPERLVIGKYCAIATGTRFLMAAPPTRASVCPPSRSRCSAATGPSGPSTSSRACPAGATP